MSTEENGNGNLCAATGTAGAGPGSGGTGTTMGGLLKPTSSSNEDLSEYTDADESISAPTEFLAEFLSAVMLKDYETALKYCKLILQYEPNNVTAKEFYPLILEKLQNTYNKQPHHHHHHHHSHHPSPSSSSPSPSDSSSDSSSDSCSSSSDNDNDNDDNDNENDNDNDVEADGECDEEEEEEEEENSGDGKRCSSDGDATTASYSSLEDEEAEQEQLSNLKAKFRVDNVDLGNGNKIICDTTGAPWEVKGMTSAGPVPVPFGTSSDSESPTEPVSQQTIAMLRAKVVPPRH